MNELLTAVQVAQQLQLSAKTVRSGGAGTSTLPKVRLGRQIRYRQVDLDRWISLRVRAPFQVAARRLKQSG